MANKVSAEERQLIVTKYKQVRIVTMAISKELRLCRAVKI